MDIILLVIAGLILFCVIFYHFIKRVEKDKIKTVSNKKLKQEKQVKQVKKDDIKYWIVCLSSSQHRSFVVYPICETEKNLLDHIYFCLAKQCTEPYEGARFDVFTNYSFSDKYVAYVRQETEDKVCFFAKKYSGKKIYDLEMSIRKSFKEIELNDEYHFDYWAEKINVNKFGNKNGVFFFTDCDYSPEREQKEKAFMSTVNYKSYLQKYGEFKEIPQVRQEYIERYRQREREEQEHNRRREEFILTKTLSNITGIPIDSIMYIADIMHENYIVCRKNATRQEDCIKVPWNKISEERIKILKEMNWRL